jgi:hypothetical protein
MKTIKYTAPSAWASYLVNDDSSGISDEDVSQCDAWLKSLGHGSPVGCEDAGFMWHHDANAFCPLGADCQTYAFLVRDEPIKAPAPSSVLGSLDTGMDVSQAVLVAVVNASGGLVTCDVEWSGHPGSREVPEGWAVHVVPLALAIRSQSVESALRELFNAFHVPDDGLPYEAQAAYDVAADVLGARTPCDDCGCEALDVVSCPDGATICRSCFDAGGH